MDGLGFDGNVEEARALLVEIDDIQLRTRADFRDGAWQWLAVWCLVCVGAVASAFTPFAGLYWWFGAPIGLVATAVVGVRADQRLRLRRKSWPGVAIGFGIAAANSLISMNLASDVVAVAVWVVLGVGFGALTALDRIERAPRMFALLTMGTVVAGVAATDRFALYPMLAAAFALTLGHYAFTTWRGVPE